MVHEIGLTKKKINPKKMVALRLTKFKKGNLKWIENINDDLPGPPPQEIGKFYFQNVHCKVIQGHKNFHYYLYGYSFLTKKNFPQKVCIYIFYK